MPRHGDHVYAFTPDAGLDGKFQAVILSIPQKEAGSCLGM